MNFESVGIGGMVAYLVIKEIASPLIKKFNPSKNGGGNGTEKIVEAIKEGNLILQKLVNDNTKEHATLEILVKDITKGVDILREREK